MATNPDFKDLLRAFNAADVKFLLIGAYAVAFYSEPRYTKDFDLWISAQPDNTDRVWKALVDFGAPLSGLTKKDLQDPQTVFQIGVEPNRIDILVQPGTIPFDEAWKRKVLSIYDGESLPIISKDDLIALKQHAGRPQDVEDIKSLK